MIEKILPGLYRIKVPLPGSPLRSVNSYLIVSSRRFLLIDTGMNREECLRHLHSALEELNVELEKTDFFITHWHADHLGLISALATPSSRIYFNRAEADALASGFKNLWQQASNFAREHGFPEGELEDVLSTHPAQYGLKEHMDFCIIEEGDEMSIGDYTFACLETPGHSPGHLCLYEANKKILVSGDHLLVDITPNISLWSNEINLLQEYLESLDRVYELDVQLVLPGHRWAFRDHRKRIQELKRHHEARINEVLSLLEEGSQTGYELASRMSWDLSYKCWEEFPAFQKWFAFGEALSHLVYLEEKGMVGRRASGQVVFYPK